MPKSSQAVDALRVRSTPCLLTALRLLHSIRNVACVAFITRLVDCVHVLDNGCCSSRACAGWEKETPRAAVEALIDRGREEVELNWLRVVCALVNTRHMLRRRGKSSREQKERGSFAFNLEDHYRTLPPINPSRYS